MNDHTPSRALSPVQWDSVSLRQIWEYLNPTESEEDVYRVTDQFGEWAESLDDHLQQHQLRWTDPAGANLGAAHLAAVDFGATTRTELAAGVADLRQVRTSLEKLTAMFVEVRRRVDRLYQETQSAHEPLLNWVLARDDEPYELVRRDNTQWARDLMRQYEHTANEELGKWPAEKPHRTGSASYVQNSAAATIPLGGNGNPRGDDSPTKPTQVNRTAPPARCTDTGMPGGAAFPATRAFDDADYVHHSHIRAPDDQAVEGRSRIAPPVIGADFVFEKDEESPW